MELVIEPEDAKSVKTASQLVDDAKLTSVSESLTPEYVKTPAQDATQEVRQKTSSVKVYQHIDPIFYLTWIVSVSLLLMVLYIFFEHNNRLIDIHLKEIAVANDEISEKIALSAFLPSASLPSTSLPSAALPNVDLPPKTMVPLQTSKKASQKASQKSSQSTEVLPQPVQPQAAVASTAADAGRLEGPTTLSKPEPEEDVAALKELLETKTQQLNYLASENHELRLRVQFGEGRLPDLDAGLLNDRHYDAPDDNVAESMLKSTGVAPEKFPSASVENHSADIDELISGAKAALDSQNVGLAGTLYNQALQADPLNLYANLGVADVAVLSGHIKLAIDRYRHLLSLYPDDQTVFQLLLALAEKNNMIEAELRSHIVEFASEPTVLHSMMGHHLGRRGRWVEANNAFMAAYHSVTDEQPLADILFNLAVSLEHTGRVSEAVHYYQRALQSEDTASFDRLLVQDRLQLLMK